MTRHARSFWIGLLEEVSAGHALGEVARRHRVRERTLRWWHWKIGRSVVAAPRFLPVVAESALRVPTCVEVAAGAASLRVQVGTDVAYVAALARALRDAC